MGSDVLMAVSVASVAHCVFNTADVCADTAQQIPIQIKVIMFRLNLANLGLREWQSLRGYV